MGVVVSAGDLTFDPTARAAAPTTCRHCALPIPGTRRADGDAFCCDGCRHVHDLIHSSGLADFYDLRGDRTLAPPTRLGTDGLAWLERELETAPAEGDLRRLTLDVQGIHCAACVWLLQELAHRDEGAVDFRLNPALGRAELLWNTAASDPSRFLREADRFGYRFGPARKQTGAGSRGLLLRLGVTVAAAMNVMIFSLSFYFGLAPTEGLLFSFFGQLNLALATVAVLVGGWPFFVAAIRSLRRGWVHLDLPIAVGITLAYAGSVRAYLAHGPREAYFDSLTVFIALMLFGRWLQERHLARNRDALLACDGVRGLTTRRVEARGVVPVAADEIRERDKLCIVSGDLVPVRGVLADRTARISLEWILGESDPRSLEVGAEVPAGALNAGDAPFEIVAVEDFAASRVHSLFEGPDRAAPKRDDFWHRLATGWVFAVLGLSTIAFLAWWSQGLDRALAVTVSVLVVTCPCALGLAAPLARGLTHGHLRRFGIFVRRDDFLDRALSVRKILFDKTGTLTSGALRLTTESRVALAESDPRDLRLLHHVVARSNHPVSRAIAAELRRLGVPSTLPDGAAGELREHPGLGVEWTGSPSCRVGKGVFAVPAGPADAATWWSIEDQARLALRLEEDLRPDAAEEAAALRSEGFDVRILSGDTPERVAEAAGRLGVEHATGGLSPEDKARMIETLDEGGDTLMVGDGLNDARAFAAAACAATPAVDRATLPSRADFYYLGAGLDAVRVALASARRLRRILRDNLAISIAYNVAALVLCFSGLVNPLLAAILMPLSSIGVVTVTALRLREGSGWK
ncbi:MAG: heavy metal translocating P-type ATPase metal-binding domain-containing protein [bacterium]